MRTMIWIVSLFVALLTISLCPIVAEGQEPTRTVVFNELMWMGSTVSTADEWIELRNTTDSPIPLEGWVITKGPADTMLTISSGTIDSAGVFLIANWDSSKSKLNVAPDMVSTKVDLSDNNLQLKLYSATGDTIDIAGDGEEPLAGNKDNKCSMVRNNDPDEGTSALNWFTAVAQLGWDSGAIEKGTPGFLEPATVRIVCDSTVVFRDTLTVSVRVENVIDLFGVNFDVVFDSSKVSYVQDSATKGDFIGQDSTYTNPSSGRINVGIMQIYEEGSVSGSGELASLRYKAIAIDGDSTMAAFSLQNVKLRDRNTLNLISTITLGDTTAIVPLKITDTSPDSAAVNVIASAPIRAMFENDPAVSVDTTVFHVQYDGGDCVADTVYYTSGIKTATFHPGSSLVADTLYTAILDSSLGMTDNYSWTFRTSVLGDIFDLDDPTDADGADDYIGDGLVDGDDLAVLGYFYYTTPAGDRWSPVADLNKDDQVNGADLVLLGINYGRTSSMHAPKMIAQNEDAPLLRLVYDEKAISEGKTCVLTVIGERMRDVYALDIGIGFDEAWWEMARVEKGALLGDRAAVIHGWDGSLLRIGATQLGRVPGVDGDGAVLRVTFRAKETRFTAESAEKGKQSKISANFARSAVKPLFRLGRAALRDSELRVVDVRIGPAVSVCSTEKSDLPKHYALSQNVPNPFNPNTEILYALPEAGDVRLRIYNTAGQCVRTLVDAKQVAGRYKAHWDSLDKRGRDVASGVYFYLLTVRGSDARWGRKMLLLR